MAETLASGLIDNTTTMTIYKDGTFSLKVLFGKPSAPERLIGFEHDADSMRRKSATGRGAAALFTGGASLLASNNRGVVYVSVTGDRSSVRTFTTRNPSGTTLTGIRSLKAAADAILAQTNAPQGGGASEVAQLQQLADLHRSGALSATEFAAAKKRLLG
ncbi:SHOCT domain-containing protein [Nocardioides jensenii]|uniref:SHOCT domain-containing protein n=1 Tax=Nocardioides jensenii TaxID=1843 RepID=UPI000834A47B|nr:SHOCT domain-containing protein [Nocardioides jensenii]